MTRLRFLAVIVLFTGCNQASAGGDAGVLGDTGPRADAGASTDSASADVGPPASDSGATLCTPTSACTVGTCVPTGAQQSCSGTWQCFAGGVPCTTDSVAYCGCDGVTFMASSTCPQRPYSHEGSCEDGVSCNPAPVVCELDMPTCDQGEVPSVDGTCWGPCVPISQCGCMSDADCGQVGTYMCIPTTNRCDFAGG